MDVQQNWYGILPATLVSHWDFEEGSGQVAADSVGIKIYIDGVEQATGLYNDGVYDGMSNTTANVTIGVFDGGGDSYDHNGQIDEVRISSAARTADWIAASYKSQNGTFAFNNFAAEETVTAGVTATDKAAAVAAITRDDANPTNANTAVFSVDFSEDVINVSAADFTLALSGVTANATVVVGNAGDADASTYTVTVDTIAGNGTLGLDIAGGNNITDLATNAVNTTPVFEQTYTIDNAAPIITAIETADLNGDGFIDAIHVTFDTTISDSSVTANDWDVAGVTGEALVWNTNGDTANDADIYITFADGVLDTAATPKISYTQDEPTDADVADGVGNELANFESWWDTAWLNRTKITFDNTNSAVNLADFPVLVKLTAADVDFDKIKALGADIRFVDDDGVLLNYEIEAWDDGAKTATVWVKVQQLDQSSNTDFIHLYYNNTGAVDAQNATGVWPSGTGVYHLDEDPGPGGAGDIKDSDATPNNGTAEASMTTGDLVTGQIGNALDFDGSDDFIDFASTDVGDTFTIQAWIKPDSTGGTKIQTIASNSSDGNTTDGFRFFIKGSSEQFVGGIGCSFEERGGAPRDSEQQSL
ncbi:MAG: DUF2341 domain-containing protein, partial [Pirellulaceae bacterium]|nr:DUF2341 domain-containing protein [Pirellulaceae bacterium]